MISVDSWVKLIVHFGHKVIQQETNRGNRFGMREDQIRAIGSQNLG